MRVGRKLKKTAYLIINLIIQIYIFEFCKGFHSIISDQSPKYAVFPSNLILPKKSSVSGLFFEIHFSELFLAFAHREKTV